MSDKELPFPIGSKDYLDALKMGYLGIAATWLLAVLNVMYYGQILYVRTIGSNYNYWGRSYKTWFGSGTGIRVFMNVVIYMFLSFFLLLAVFDNCTLFMVLFYAGWIAGMLYAIRTLAAALFMLFGLMMDDFAYYSDTSGSEASGINYFKDSVAFGPLMGEEVGQNRFFRMLDMQLEAANMVVGMMAGAFFNVGMTIWRPLYNMGYGSVPYKAVQAAPAAPEPVVVEEPEPKDDEDGF